jgi:hypothetical protein
MKKKKRKPLLVMYVRQRQTPPIKQIQLNHLFKKEQILLLIMGKNQVLFTILNMPIFQFKRCSMMIQGKVAQGCRT